MSRTKRRPYRGSKAVDTSCRSKGSCPVCGQTYRYKQAKKEPLALGDGAAISDAVRQYLRQNFTGLAQASEKYGVSQSYLSQIQTGIKAPSERILNDMGLSKKRIVSIVPHPNPPTEASK